MFFFFFVSLEALGTFPFSFPDSTNALKKDPESLFFLLGLVVKCRLPSVLAGAPGDLPLPLSCFSSIQEPMDPLPFAPGCLHGGNAGRAAGRVSLPWLL